MSSDPNEGLMPIYGSIPTILMVDGYRCVFYLHIDFIDYMAREGKDKVIQILRVTCG